MRKAHAAWANTRRLGWENATCYLPRGDAIMRTSRESRTPDAYGGASTDSVAWHFVP
ncbi:MAG: hypothetical protein KME49_10550 [Brasilonema octagenarum HA4186-MV1]|nr:hypothetical protein [Brasilonema octagenarum HA4186-MV1]